jgi:cytochrome c5
MRYTRVGKGSWWIGVVLLGAALVFAVLRSQGRRGAEPQAQDAFEWEVMGAQVYKEECESCHPQGEARRARGAPAVRGLAAELFASEGGREYLLHFLLTGEVRVQADGQPQLELRHPPFDELTDIEGAAVLNHMLTAWGNQALLPRDARLYAPEELAAARSAEDL